jgi:hypothetical protein
VETAKLVAGDGLPGDDFGTRVAIDGDDIAIGAPERDDLGTRSGAIYVFEFQGSGWVEAAKLLTSDGAAVDLVGTVLDISQDTIVAGVYGDDDLGPSTGAIYVFEDVAGAWSETQKLLASDARPSHSFGSELSLSGSSLLVGALNDDALGAFAGAGYLFEKQGATWVEQSKAHG